MNKIVFHLPDGDLASRHLAINERGKLEPYIARSEKIYLDLSDVISISESYSDELFGILVVKYGFEHVLSSLKIENASRPILQSIAIVMKRRLEQVNKKNKTMA
ncbi:STAS-like domain-containing protein [Xenorhabdus bovienii]|uniref:STAS-like domain-containing protein n=1 Tax=Xenorhabdus bovienii TaxID=40576 RepID=UPI0023B272BF|nr:STAS-like domain-containing protein [Xenorhabdus bovienii]MDE9429652.1 STAS-like domain-containing protein [Xenorhabdus bovienii]MDE9464426.1 STAS-like domain-containing protein [Xenorhabdus bovienii]